MMLAIIHQQWPTNLDRWAALGSIDIEGASDWVDAMQECEDLQLLVSRSAHVRLQATRYLLPESGDVTEVTFENKASVDIWTYTFTGTPEELDQLVDKLTVVQGRRDLASSP